jgi:aspartate kinase
MSERKIVVQKYGGSSVSDIEGIRHVANRIVESTRAGWSVVVVVSAMGNTTDALISLAKSISPNPTRRELDLLISVGERISMTLLAMAVEKAGVRARSFTGSQSGIITDEQHVCANILEVRPHRIQQALEDGFVAIVAGFQGMSRSKEVTTLGRGGSDTTAVALTAALGAEYCEICSDVDGVYSADPRIVDTAQKWKEMRLHDAWILAKHGAKVLQAVALEYALEKKISISANATKNPVGAGTLLKIEGGTPTFGVTSRKVRYLAGVEEIPDWVEDGLLYCWCAEDGMHVIFNPENIHHDSNEGRLCATVSILGSMSASHFLSLLPEARLHWWRIPDVWVALVPMEGERDLVADLHRSLQT